MNLKKSLATLSFSIIFGTTTLANNYSATEPLPNPGPHYHRCELNTTIHAQAQESIVYKNISNTPEQLLSLDIYNGNIALQNKKPVIIWLHGGGWASGDKQEASIPNKVKWMNDNNYIFVSVNYRLASCDNEPQKDRIEKLLNNLDGQTNNFEERIMFKSIDQDVKDAITWIYKNIDKYGGDKNKIVLGGFSAGADIASRVAIKNKWLRDNDLPDNLIKGVLAVDISTYDLNTLMMHEKTRYKNNISPHFYDDYLNAFGSDPLLWAQASVYYPDINLINHDKQIDQDNKHLPYFFIISGNPSIDGIANYSIVKNFYDQRIALENSSTKIFRRSQNMSQMIITSHLTHAEINATFLNTTNADNIQLHPNTAKIGDRPIAKSDVSKMNTSVTTFLKKLFVSE